MWILQLLLQLLHNVFDLLILVTLFFWPIMKETFPIENDPQKQASGTIESPPAPQSQGATESFSFIPGLGQNSQWKE